MERRKDWPRSRHERFNHLAGAHLEELGYAPKRFQGRRWWYARNGWLDMNWSRKRFTFRVRRRLTRIWRRLVATGPST